MFRVELLVVLFLRFSANAEAYTTLQAIQPIDGLVCPGGEVILTCAVTRVQQAHTVQPTLVWQQHGADPSEVRYRGGAPLTATLGDFTTTAIFSNGNYKILSNATLKGALFNHNLRVISCHSPPGSRSKVTVMVAGAGNSPSQLNIFLSSGTPATLTWLPPPSGSNCTFNYTVNITSNSSSVTEQVYNSTSLTLTNLTRGENYSFAVAVTDSAEQYGSWSEKMNVLLKSPTSSHVHPATITGIFSTNIHIEDRDCVLTTAIIFISSFMIKHHPDSVSTTETIHTETMSMIPTEAEQAFAFGGCTIHTMIAALSGGVLSAILTSLLTSFILRCHYTIREKKRKDRDYSVQQGVDKPLPVEHAVQNPTYEKSETQGNVVYEEIFSLQQNPAYEQVHCSLQQNPAYEQVHNALRQTQ